MRGASLVDYALLVSVVAAVALGTLTVLRVAMFDALVGAVSQMDSANSAAPALGTAEPLVPTTTLAVVPPASVPSTVAAATSTSVSPAAAPPAVTAAVGFDYDGNRTFGNAVLAVASGFRASATLTAPTAATYRVEFEILRSGPGASSSVYVGYDDRIVLYNTVSGVSAPTWQSGGVPGGSGATEIVVTLAEGEDFDVSVYPRTSGVTIGAVRLVPIG